MAKTMDVRIEQRQQRGITLWQVWLGKRCLTFHEEVAARAFAAQLHYRLLWLRQTVEGEQ
jgi:hypothetical protein